MILQIQILQRMTLVIILRMPMKIILVHYLQVCQIHPQSHLLQFNLDFQQTYTELNYLLISWRYQKYKLLLFKESLMMPEILTGDILLPETQIHNLLLFKE